MRGRYLFAALLMLCSLVPALAAPEASAAAPATGNRGLLITPLRSYVDVEAGNEVTRSFTVVNVTDKPVVVDLSVEQFSIADAAYNYRFSEPENDWVRMVETLVTLQPGKSHTAAYRIAVPKGAAPGGHYYTLLASTTLQDGGFAGRVRAASLLYLTVKGNLNRTSMIEKASAPWIVVTPTIPYVIDVKNTGNIHYFAYFSARLDSLFYQNAPTGTSNLLMPGATRHIEGSVTAPLLPGIYKLTYGYKTDAGDTHMSTQYLLHLPLWFLAALTIALLFVYRRFKRKPQTEPATTE